MDEVGETQLIQGPQRGDHEAFGPLMLAPHEGVWRSSSEGSGTMKCDNFYYG